MNVLVTGAGGFVGGRLVAHLLASGDRVVVAYEHEGQRPRASRKLIPVVLDVTNDQMAMQTLAEHDVEAVIHLAAIAFVPSAEENPARTMAVNVGGVAAMLRAVKLYRPHARFLFASSAEVYGRSAADGRTLTERDALQPMNVYAQSKLLAEQCARWYAENHGLDVLIARPFPHLGPGQDPAFSISGFARQLSLMAAGRTEPTLRVGNLAVCRDLTDVRDVVRAYRLALENMPSGDVFNICSGREFQLADLVDELIRLSGVAVQVEVDEARLRPVDLFCLRGSAEHLHRQTGWRPAVMIDQTLRDVYQYWLDQQSDK